MFGSPEHHPNTKNGLKVLLVWDLQCEHHETISNKLTI